MMRTLFFSTKSYDKNSFTSVEKPSTVEFEFCEPHLDAKTARLAEGFDAVCAFVNDDLDAATLDTLNEVGVQAVALRCAGFNNVDVKHANQLNLVVVRVPAYSPYAVAEHTIGLVLALNRKIHRAYNRVRELNFELSGLLGFDLHGKTVGIIGTGKIGAIAAKLFLGFGCRVLAYDVQQNTSCAEMGVQYVEADQLYCEADVISLHCPLVEQTYHLIDERAIGMMKPGVMIINTSRGALIDTSAVIGGLKSRKIGSLGLDVYEEEADLFFEDQSDRVITDDVFARLLTFPNVLVTGHQAFFTQEALAAIASTTLENLADLAAGRECQNAVTDRNQLASN